ncbi:ABC transporter ATP-binding protein [Halosegnis sp.]|uniref:ABC transporter ATP-binding protein n=1 Tax=Halosegnis sp. TaxID=2864959 RepID=UPI0035D52085
MIRLDDVTRRYGTVTALEGVSLSLPRGTLTGLVGTNGAGKTTLFRLLVGHERPDGGTVRVAGQAPADSVAVRRTIGYLPERTSFEPALTGREVVRFHARRRGVARDRRRERVAATLETVGLADAADRAVGGYSNGMSRRLGLATLLVGAPDVLLLDEPTASLDPPGVETVRRLVERVHAETNATVLISSHDLGDIERLCDRVVVLDDGHVRASGPVDAVAGDRTFLRITPAGDATAADAAAVAREFADTRVVRVGERRCVLSVPDDAALDRLAALRSAVGVETFEADRTGLAAAFPRLLDDADRADHGPEVADD